MEFFTRIVETGHAFAAWNQLADLCMTAQSLEIYRAVLRQNCSGKICQDRHFVAGTLKACRPAIAQSHETEHGFLSCGLRFLVARQDRENQCVTTEIPRVTGVECCGQAGHRTNAVHCPFGTMPVRIVAEQIATQTKSKIHFPGMGGFHAPYRVIAGGLRDRESQPLVKLFKHGLFQSRSNAYGAEALDIAVSSNRHYAGVASAHHASKKCQVGNHLDIIRAVKMMSNAHAPANHGVVRRTILFGEICDLLACQPAVRFNVLPHQLFHEGAEFRESFRMLINEGLILGIPVEDLAANACKQCEVTAAVRR